MHEDGVEGLVVTIGGGDAAAARPGLAALPQVALDQDALALAGYAFAELVRRGLLPVGMPLGQWISDAVYERAERVLCEAMGNSDDIEQFRLKPETTLTGGTVRKARTFHWGG